jgi:hypothetical protein
MMIGREAVLSEVSHRLREERFGPGSIGKTTVALAVGRAAAEEFSGQVHFVDLGIRVRGSYRAHLCSEFAEAAPHPSPLIPNPSNCDSLTIPKSVSL